MFGIYNYLYAVLSFMFAQIDQRLLRIEEAKL